MKNANAPRVDPALLSGNHQPAADYVATHFKWQVSEGVAMVTAC